MHRLEGCKLPNGRKVNGRFVFKRDQPKSTIKFLYSMWALGCTASLATIRCRMQGDKERRLRAYLLYSAGRNDRRQRSRRGRMVDQGQVAIDEKDNVEYESLCAQCYFQLLNEKNAGNRHLISAIGYQT